MTCKVWLMSLAAGACVLLALTSGAVVEARAALTSEESPTWGGRTYANAQVVAIGPEARTITVRGGGIGKDETFTVESEAVPGVRALRPGDQVVLSLRAIRAGEETVTRIARSSPAKPVRRAAGRRDTPASGSAVPVTTAVTPAPPPPVPPAASAPSPGPTSLPTDIVGPFRDPRVDPNLDPRQDPLRDPRVIPGLSEPAPTPTPSPR
jgi:hypothetical protein